MALGCIAPFGDAYDRAGLTRGDKFGHRSPDASPPGPLARQNSPSTSRAGPLPVQNSPGTPLLAACAVQNSPCSPEMARCGAFSACRESFIPFPPTKKPSREKFVPNARQRSSDPTQEHTRPRAEGAGGSGGPGRGAGGRFAGPTQVRGASARQISHIISHGHFSRPPENVAIPTMQIQCLNKLQGNYVRNCCAKGPGRSAGGVVSRIVV